MDPSRSESLARALAPILPELLTPALVLDLDAVAHNIAATLARVGGPQRWRPHLKTCKQAVVVERMLALGLRYFKVATPDELALVLRGAEAVGVTDVDVLFAYPATPPTLAVVLSLAHAHAGVGRVSVLADSPDHLIQLAEFAQLTPTQRDPSLAEPLAVMLDVDLGMHRTGTPPEDWAAQLGRVVARGVSILGLHGYDGQLRWDQRAEAHAGYDRLCALARAPELARALELEFELVTSGTHSYAHALAHPELGEGPWQHRVSPGTVVLSDLRSHAAAADIGLRQAAYVATRVISVGPGRVTCDAGSKAITPDGSPPTCAVVDHPQLEPQRASEEHLPCLVASVAGTQPLVAGLAPLRLGDLLFLIPDHVCTTVNLHREAVWLRDGRFAGFGPIAAAGHRPRLATDQIVAQSPRLPA